MKCACEELKKKMKRLGVTSQSAVTASNFKVTSYRGAAVASANLGKRRSLELARRFDGSPRQIEELTWTRNEIAAAVT